MLLLAILRKYFGDADLDEWELIEELAVQRSKTLLEHAFKGYGISWEQAIKAAKDMDPENSQQMEVRDILSATISNMAEFASAQEYQVWKNISGMYDLDDLDEDELEEVLGMFERYNKIYARTENLDVEYALSVASKWVLINISSEVMYMTQGDERVRPWHLQWEGYTAPKVMFPSWLIPPIEHQCRCYLVETGPLAKVDILKDVRAEIVKDPVMPEWFNKTFKESVCRGGRIFSDEHPYFQIEASDTGRLSKVVDSVIDIVYGNR